MSASAYNKYETGKSSMTIEMVYQVAQFLGVTVGKILNINEGVNNVDSPNYNNGNGNYTFYSTPKEIIAFGIESSEINKRLLLRMSEKKRV